MPEVSIIVPVYNKGQYLQECIDSICKQSYQNFELILIDDGSTDNSGNICDKAADSDNRIIVFHTENKGVGAARNLGINKAKGEYIMFVDADDMLDCRCLQIMVDNMEPDVDMVVSGYYELCNHNIEKHIVLSEAGVYKREEYLKEFLKNGMHCYYNGPCAKLIRNNFKQYNVKYENHEILWEDFIFSVRLLRNINKIKIIDEKLYMYRIDVESSLYKTKHNTKVYYKRYMKLYRELCKTIAFMANQKDYQEYLCNFQNTMVKKIVRNVLFDETINGIQRKFEMLEKLRKKFETYHFLNLYDKGNLKQKSTVLLLKYRQYYVLYLLFQFNYVINKVILLRKE